MQLSVVWHTIRPSGVVRHWSYVRRIFMYHDAHMRLEYDVPFNSMTVPVGTIYGAPLLDFDVQWLSIWRTSVRVKIIVESGNIIKIRWEWKAALVGSRNHWVLKENKPVNHVHVCRLTLTWVEQNSPGCFGPGWMNWIAVFLKRPICIFQILVRQL